jgi:hypothetical protein
VIGFLGVLGFLSSTPAPVAYAATILEMSNDWREKVHSGRGQRDGTAHAKRDRVIAVARRTIAVARITIGVRILDGFAQRAFPVAAVRIVSGGIDDEGCFAAYTLGDDQEKPPTIGRYPGTSSCDRVARRQSAVPLLRCPMRAATSITDLAGLTGTIGEPN